MEDKVYKMAGRITQADRKTGVHGLRIEVFDKDCLFHDRLGGTLTHRDGFFSMTYCESDFAELFEQKPSVYVRIRDRDGKMIYVHKQTDRFRPGGMARFDIALAKKVLADHLSRPVSWERTGGHLVSRDKLNQVERAVSLIAAPDTSAYQGYLRDLKCWLPPIDDFPNFMEDIWGVLEGELDAAIRLRDMLEIFYGHSLRRDPDLTARLSEEVSKLFSGDAPESIAVNQQAFPPPNPAHESLIDRNRAIPLIMASVHVGGGVPSKIKRNLEAVLSQLCGYSSQATLYRAASMALRGGTKEVTFFRNMLGQVGGCGPDDRPIPSFDTPKEIGPVDCTSEAIEAFKRSRRLAYTITDVSPDRACAGATIKILGSGFGDDPGKVRFSTGGAFDIDVEPTEWSATRVTVVVPAEASCGPVSLLIVEDTLEVCDEFIDTYRAGTSLAHFEGTLPVIFSFLINGTTDLTPGPDTELTLSWHLCNVTEFRVRRTSEIGPPIDVVNPPGNSYSLGRFSAPPGDATYELVATNACGTTRATVTLHLCRLSVQLSTVGLEHDVTVTPFSGPVVLSLARSSRLTLMASGHNVCGVRNVWVGGASTSQCVSGDIGVTRYGEYAQENRAARGEPAQTTRTVMLTIELDRVGRCPDGYSFQSAGVSLSATAEDMEGRSVTTGWLSVEIEA